MQIAFSVNFETFTLRTPLPLVQHELEFAITAPSYVA